MATPLSEEHFFKVMAERPEDRSLRLVFSDWLQEQGDPRGEAIALWEDAKGDPPASVRRKLRRLQEKHGRGWLGPGLASLVSIPHTGWEGGLAVSLMIQRELAPPRWAALVGEPRLATVRHLEFSPFLRWPPTAFFTHPVLGGLKVLSAPLHLWAPLAGARLPCALVTAGLVSLGRFEGELGSWMQVEAVRSVPALRLKTLEMVNGSVAAELRRSLRDQRRAWVRQARVELDLVHGTLEGAATWLVPGADRTWLAETWEGAEWAVRLGGVAYRLTRDRDGALTHLAVDLDGGEGAEGLEARLASAVSVLVQLDPVQVRVLELRLPSGARLKATERSALRAAARRLTSIQRLTVDGAPVEP